MDTKQNRNIKQTNNNKICYISNKSVLISTIINEDQHDEVDELMATYKQFHWTESY